MVGTGHQLGCKELNIGTAGQHASQLLAQVGLNERSSPWRSNPWQSLDNTGRNHCGRQFSIGTPLPNSGVGKKRTAMDRIGGSQAGQ
jgi:hypothetical protein